MDRACEGESMFEDEDDLDDDGEEDDDDEKRGQAKFITAQFTASCVKCKTTFRTTGWDAVLAFSGETLTPAQVKDAWPRISGDEFYDRGVEPFWDELPAIAAFLKKHATHAVTVGLEGK